VRPRDIRMFTKVLLLTRKSNLKLRMFPLLHLMSKLIWKILENFTNTIMTKPIKKLKEQRKFLLDLLMTTWTLTTQVPTPRLSLKRKTTTSLMKTAVSMLTEKSLQMLLDSQTDMTSISMVLNKSQTVMTIYEPLNSIEH